MSRDGILRDGMMPNAQYHLRLTKIVFALHLDGLEVE